MNKLFKKISMAFVGIAMAIGVGVAIGVSDKRPVPVYADSAEISFADQGWSNGSTHADFTVDSFRFLKSGTGNAPAYYTSDSTLRYYKNSTLTISSTNGSSISAVSSSPSQTFSVSEGQASISFSSTVKFESITITYTPSVTYTITYNANGGSGTMTNTTGANPAVASCSFASPSDDMVFDYWHTNSSGTGGTTYAVGATPGKNVDLYAIWKDKPTLSSIAITTPPTKTSYYDGESFDSTGMVVTATYSDASTDNVTESCSFEPSGALTTSDDSVTVSYTFSDVTKTATQAITVSVVPGFVNFGTASGAIQMSSNSGSGTDTLGNSVSSSCNSGAFQSNSSGYTQVGSKDYALTTWTTTVIFDERVGVESFEIKFAGSAGSANAEYVVYGDSVYDEILSGGVDGSTEITDSTDGDYSTINANSITVSFTGSAYGVKLYYFSYVLGDTVQEFGTLDRIEVKAGSKHETTFKVGQTFSTSGLVIVATDTVDFTKEYTKGFTTNYDDHTFVAGDVADDVTVTVSLTIGGKTKSTTYTIDIINPPTYTLASSSDLYEGTTVIVAYIDGSDNVYTAGAINGTFLGEVDGSVDGDDVSAGVETIEFTICYYASNIMLRSGDKYLKHNGDKSVSLVSSYDAACVWAYDGSSLQNVSASSYYLRYNTANPRFTSYSSSGQNVGLYVSSATPKTDPMEADTFAYRYLHLRDYQGTEGVAGSNYCLNNGDGAGKNYFADAATAYYSLDASVKAEFKKNTEAVKRFNAWAAANRKSIDLDTGVVSAAGANRVDFGGIVTDSNLSLIITFATIGTVSAAGGFFFIQHKRRSED